MSKNQEETKRISFDREQRVEITTTGWQFIFDPEELLTGWERIYTHPSICDENAQATPTKYRFGTGDKQKIKWHTEQVTPAGDVYYTIAEEYHARQHNIGVFGVIGATVGDVIIIVWHGYDKRIRER